MALVVGIAFLFCGGLFVWGLKQTPPHLYRRMISFCAFFFIFGIVAIVGQITQNVIILYSGIFLPIGIIGIMILIYNVYMLKKCTLEILAECVDYNLYSVTRRGITQKTYAPVFRYYYMGKEYSQQSGDSYSYKKIQKKLQKGNKYNLYINPEVPEDCIYEKKIKVYVYLFALMGLLILSLYIYLIFEALS